MVAMICRVYFSHPYWWINNILFNRVPQLLDPNQILMINVANVHISTPEKSQQYDELVSETHKNQYKITTENHKSYCSINIVRLIFASMILCMHCLDNYSSWIISSNLMQDVCWNFSRNKTFLIREQSFKLSNKKKDQ